jgi:hypothetical protein
MEEFVFLRLIEYFYHSLCYVCVRDIGGDRDDLVIKV